MSYSYIELKTIISIIYIKNKNDSPSFKKNILII